MVRGITASQRCPWPDPWNLGMSGYMGGRGFKSAGGIKFANELTTILQPVEQKPHSQKDRQNEKAEDYVPHEATT